MVPVCPIHPALYVSPLTCAFDTAFTLYETKYNFDFVFVRDYNSHNAHSSRESIVWRHYTYVLHVFSKLDKTTLAHSVQFQNPYISSTVMPRLQTEKKREFETYIKTASEDMTPGVWYAGSNVVVAAASIMIHQPIKNCW